MTHRLLRQYHQKRPVSTHSRGPACHSAPPPGYGVAAALTLALTVALIAASVGGCAVSVPIASLSGADGDATAAIPGSALERLLEPEDWRRARAALSTALDPQGDGSLVSWDNPQSGARGSFAPIGKAYPSDARICRRFKTDVAPKSGARAMQGVACAAKDGEWIIAELNAPRPG